MVASCTFTKIRGLRGTPGPPPGSAPVKLYEGIQYQRMCRFAGDVLWQLVEAGWTAQWCGG